MRPGGRYTRVTEEFVRNLRGVPQQNFYLGTLLYEFETNEADILQGHVEGLNNSVYPQLGPDISVFVVGFASRLGGEQHNAALSHRRANRVARRIAFESGRPAGFVRITSVGEDLSGGGPEDDGYRRAVAVLLYRHPRPQLPQRRPAAPVESTTARYFRIRFVDSDFHGPHIGVGVFVFEIDYDPSGLHPPPSDPVRYAIVGPGVGRGASLPAPDSNNLAWNRFDVAQPRTTHDFVGSAEFGRVGWTGDDFDNTYTEFILLLSDGTRIFKPWFSMPPGRSLEFTVIRGPFALS